MTVLFSGRKSLLQLNKKFDAFHHNTAIRQHGAVHHYSILATMTIDQSQSKLHLNLEHKQRSVPKV